MAQFWNPAQKKDGWIDLCKMCSLQFEMDEKGAKSTSFLKINGDKIELLKGSPRRPLTKQLL